MALYTVSCIGLQTNGNIRKSIYEKLVETMPNNHIEGIQRALMILQHPFTDEIADAYSTIAYFHSNETSPGQMRFKKEDRIWAEEDVKKRLKRNKKLEQTLDVQRTESGIYTVTIRKIKEKVKESIEKIPRKLNSEDFETPEVLSLENFFIRQGAFPRAVKSRTRIIENNN